MKKGTSKTLTFMSAISGVSLILAVIFFVLDGLLRIDFFKAFAITFLTIGYHFGMRIIVGELVTAYYKNKEFPQNRFDFKLLGFEKELYRKLKVKKWKPITAKPEQFDIAKVSPSELLHNVLQAELVHRIIALLSFLPVLLIIPFGAAPVFIITSVISFFIDLKYVIIQRNNRPSVIRHLNLMKNK